MPKESVRPASNEAITMIPCGIVDDSLVGSGHAGSMAFFRVNAEAPGDSFLLIKNSGQG